MKLSLNNDAVFLSCTISLESYSNMLFPGIKNPISHHIDYTGDHLLVLLVVVAGKGWHIPMKLSYT